MKAHHSYIVPCGSALLAIGLIIRYHIGKRRFNRRGMAGLPRFPTYGKAVFTTLWERLLMSIGNLLLLAGSLLLALAGSDHFKF